MALQTAHVAGDWTAQRTPLLLQHYPHPQILSCDDIAGQYPVASPGVWQVSADGAVIDRIGSDSRYMVLYAEDVPDAA